MKSLALAAFALAALALPAKGAMLYKSIGPNGTVTFSDVPPPEGSRIVEQRVIGASGSVSGMPSSSRPIGGALDQLLDGDGEVARASEQVDLAEHALAQARRELWTPREGLTLATRRITLADQDRLEFYKKNVKVARQALMDLLRERVNVAPEPGAPRIIAYR